MEQFRILLVEDSASDAQLTKIWLSQSPLIRELQIVRDGESALGVLQCDRDQLPDVVLLDLNLPKLNGFEVLRAIRATPAIRDLSVIMLTGSSADEDHKRAAQLQANRCISKPADADEFAALTRLVEELAQASRQSRPS